MQPGKGKKMTKFAIFFAMVLAVGCSSDVREGQSSERSEPLIQRIIEKPKEEKPPISLTYARTLVGLHERRNTAELKVLIGVNPIQTEWCAAFVNSILNRQGVAGSESVSEYPLTARSFLQWGMEVLDEPQYGDVIVFPRGKSSWEGHVGFYVGTRVIDEIDYYIILGGNQDNSVSYELYPAYRALGVRRAI